MRAFWGELRVAKNGPYRPGPRRGEWVAPSAPMEVVPLMPSLYDDGNVELSAALVRHGMRLARRAVSPRAVQVAVRCSL